jgi:hypothetical protein
MFERNKIDNAAERAMVLVPAEVMLDGEDKIAGKFVVPGGRTLFQVLNGADAFLEFEPYGEARRMVAKAAIRNVTLTTVPAAGQLGHRLREIDTFDPAAILGVAPDCSIETARTAYHRLARRYHPDRFASVELPDEVRDYLAAMAQRLNLAFAALEAGDERRKAVAVAVPASAAPVYTSAPRF